ncbi:MAG TPA: hypothetical protein VNN24_03795 [Candidatus Binatus sp.]|jgi:hypothetical protein|nr:hypothetical protein [Candidatus Binatus sp.]
MESTLPRYVPAARMAELVGVSRPTLRKNLRMLRVRPSAYVNDRPLFLLEMPETRVEIDIADFGATVERFQAIGEDPDRFQAFVNAGVAAV